jgi:glycosyltransferase involved in cell wall biosynthesis
MAIGACGLRGICAEKAMTGLIVDVADQIVVVIPCYRCAETIADVVDAVPAQVSSIICVNDGSDDDLANVLRTLVKRDPSISFVNHQQNQGVGAATISGYRAAIERGARVIVKIDSDKQMNPAFIPAMASPILADEADYVKGNRFFDIERVRVMPARRLLGNAGLTFISRVSSGYWDLSDPTNGFTAIHSGVAALLPLHKLHPRYFFESDILFRLNSFGAVVVEQPIETIYQDETSQLSIVKCLVTFPFLHLRNFLKRLFYNYFLRNFDVASLYLLAGFSLTTFGAIFGIVRWRHSALTGEPATTGTVMLSVLPLILGFQLLLAFLHHDVARIPRIPIQRRISSRKVLVSNAVEK